MERLHKAASIRQAACLVKQDTVRPVLMPLTRFQVRGFRFQIDRIKMPHSGLNCKAPTNHAKGINTGRTQTSTLEDRLHASNDLLNGGLHLVYRHLYIAAGVRRAILVGYQHPERQIEDHAKAVQHGQDDKRDPDYERVNPNITRQTTGDAAEQSVALAAGDTLGAIHKTLHPLLHRQSPCGHWHLASAGTTVEGRGLLRGQRGWWFSFLKGSAVNWQVVLATALSALVLSHQGCC